MDYHKYLEYVNEIKKEINIETLEFDFLNDKDSLKLFESSKKLNWRIEPCERFLKNCKRNNQCPIGCPSSSKQSMNETYLKKLLRNMTYYQI